MHEDEDGLGCCRGVLSAVTILALLLLGGQAAAALLEWVVS